MIILKILYHLKQMVQILMLLVEDLLFNVNHLVLIILLIQLIVPRIICATMVKNQKCNVPKNNYLTQIPVNVKIFNRYFVEQELLI
jgi:hypothetical protein